MGIGNIVAIVSKGLRGDNNDVVPVQGRNCIITQATKQQRSCRRADFKFLISHPCPSSGPIACVCVL